jgi:hypothetical protein
MANVSIRRWAKRAAVLGVLGFGWAVSAEKIVGQQPSTRAQAASPPSVEKDRPVAYLYDTIAVSREEFGQFLMDRGGAEKLENFVNIKIIEAEAKRLNISVTKTEMEAALAEDLQGIPVNQNDFIKVVLPKYGKTLYEWMEDVVRPRLLLTKMLRDEVKVEDAHLKIQYERLYGEKRRVQMILWPDSYDKNLRDKLWNKIRSSAEEFDAEAVKQPNPALATVKGYVQPITRHLPAEDRTVEEEAFKLKVGEVSVPIKTAQGWVVLKLHEVIPPNQDVTFETEKSKLYKAAFDERIAQEIPKKFAQLKEAAKPRMLYAPPSEWKTVPASPLGSITVPGSGGVGPGAIQPAGGTKK